jgi:hypothetical protein
MTGERERLRTECTEAIQRRSATHGANEPTGQSDGRFLKQAWGTDFHDAMLEAWKDVYPPSDEVRGEQET